MKAVLVRGGTQNSLALGEVEEPSASAYSLLVAVRAFSLNRGEVHTALSSSADGARPGWDFAGVVEEAPADCGFSVGDRVFGLCPAGAWAERIAVPAPLVARIPDPLSFEQAACLPVAGLTAAIALDKRGPLQGLRVLVTGATGGVGLIAVQLASAGGAQVSALARRDHALLQQLGVQPLSPEALAGSGKEFDLIVDAVGGAVLGDALGRLASRGVCVLCGNAGGAITTFDGDRFRHREGAAYGGTTLYGFFLGEELTRGPPAERLTALAEAVVAGRLDPMIRKQADWNETPTVAAGLLARDFIGKAVLTIPS